jgi:hypothetical protein
MSAGMLAACAEARNIQQARILDWVRSEGLDDPSRFLPALERALEALAGEGGWLFDRRLLPPLRFGGAAPTPTQQEPDQARGD